MVFGEAAVVVVIGEVLGIAGAAGVTRSLTSLLFEIQPLDPLTFAVAPVVVGLGVLTAIIFPTYRATTVNPRELLQAE